jgi:hypothetical protein
MGYIDVDQLAAAAAAQRNSDYGAYLRRILRSDCLDFGAK